MPRFEILQFLGFILIIQVNALNLTISNSYYKKMLNKILELNIQASNYECGKSIISPSIDGNNLNKIINGKEAIPNSWPWMVSLRYFDYWSSDYKHICGGSLVSEEYIITAAHCLKGLSKFDFMVVVGVHNLNEALASQNKYDISEMIIHENYDESNILLNDIGIIKLTRKVTLSNKVQILCLPNSSDKTVIYDKFVVITGWGATKTSDISNVLLQAKISVINYRNQYCEPFNNRNYCVLDLSIEKSNICFGDSGGPLLYFMNGRWYLYGITSFVYIDQYKYCINEKPTFFTIVPDYIKWIESKSNNIIVPPPIPQTTQTTQTLQTISTKTTTPPPPIPQTIQTTQTLQTTLPPRSTLQTKPKSSKCSSLAQKKIVKYLFLIINLINYFYN